MYSHYHLSPSSTFFEQNGQGSICSSQPVGSSSAIPNISRNTCWFSPQMGQTPCFSCGFCALIVSVVFTWFLPLRLVSLTGLTSFYALGFASCFFRLLSPPPDAEVACYARQAAGRLDNIRHSTGQKNIHIASDFRELMFCSEYNVCA